MGWRRPVRRPVAGAAFEAASAGQWGFVRLILEGLAWWVVLAAVWLATLSSLTATDLYVGAAVAAAGAVVAVLGRRAVRQSWSPSPRWLWQAGPTALRVVTGGARLVARCARRGGRDLGGLSQWPAPPDEPAPRAAARRALTTLARSATPDSYVVDWPHDGGPMVHRLRRPEEEERT